jgi:7-carboxy-7-deazaguanine synthase
VKAQLRISEIFCSLQGEARLTGCPSTFIRLTGCPLRCRYCDTAYAFSGGKLMTLQQILNQVADYGVNPVCVTGGEPLAQPAVFALLTQLCDQGYQVSLETSGALSVAQVDKRVSKVVDIKTPDSGECQRNDFTNLDHLTQQDQIKLVICSEADYQWAKQQLVALNLLEKNIEVLFSPSYGQLDPQQLADWILADRLPVRLQIQLHKYLWGDQPGR